MKKILSLGLFLLFSVTLSAQITANGNSGTAATAYTNGAPSDPIYIWCAEGLGTTSGSLTASSPTGAGPFTFRWYYHNQANSSWTLYSTQAGVATSTISNLASDGYRVQIYNAANTLLACYNAWVWNMNGQLTASSQPTWCDETNLLGTAQANGSFTYYNPPPPESIITPTTQISVTFNATHTYVSDLAFYLVAPNGTTLPLMPNPGVTGNPGGGICNSSDNVINFTLNNTSTNYIDVCTPDVPLGGTYGGYWAGNPLVQTPINWSVLYGLNAAAGGWAVQIYDCIGADVGALTNASIVFNNLDATCNAQTSISYTSGNISSVINDNSCSAATASIFQVPVSPTLSTPITINASTSYLWTSTAGSIANPAALNTSAEGLPIGTTDFFLTFIVSYQNTVCSYMKQTSFTREPIPLGEPEELTICAAGPGPFNFDLTENNEEILAGLDPNEYIVSFYHTFEDADEDLSRIQNPGVHAIESGDEETIYVRVESYTTACYEVTSFVIKKNPAPEASSPEDQQMCDEDNNGSEIFNLASLDGDALAGQDPNDFIVTYHNTLAGANANDDAVADATAHPVTDGMTVYIRVTSVDDEDCYSVSTVDFIVTPTPEIVPQEDKFACSDTGYELTAIEVGDYYTAPGGPDGTGTLIADGTVLFTSQTVYIYAESNTTPNNCTDEESFEVTIYELPVVDEPADVAACESYILPELNVGEYFTQPDGEGDVLAAGTEVTETITLYVYAESGTEDTVLCTDEHEFTITIDKRPELIAATPLEECDNNFDGVTTFDLTDAGDQVINGATDVIVTYHTTATGTDPIDAPETFQSGSTTVYVRVIKASSTTDCYSVEPVELIVHPKPAITPVSDYVVCDDNNSPDGVEVFDLTTKNAEVTSNPDVTVTYYASQQNAIDEELPVNADSFESGNATVWVRLESSFGCYNVTSFDLVVNPLPVVATDMEPFYACEEEPGQGLFDLNEIEPVVTIGASGYGVSYYGSLQDAQDGFENTRLPLSYLSPSATIYVRVENVITECTVITTADLEVRPAPIAPVLAPLEECDFNNDMVAEFNMIPVLDYIEAQLGNVTAIPYETYNDAFYNPQNNIIPNPGTYTNNQALTTNGVQTIYIRVESDQTDCFDIVELQLIVHPVPVAIEPEPFPMCDNGPDDTDGIAIFDLTTREEEILGTMDPALYSIAFYTSADFAAQGTNVGRITTPAAYPSPTGSVFARVTNNATGCYDVMELELIVNPLPVANDPVPYTLCDENDPGNEVEEFDLTSKIDEIISVAGVPQTGLVVTFYHTYENAVDGVDFITNPEAYTSSSAVETIFVKVENETTGCYRIVLLDVRVEPLPVLVPPTTEELTICDTTGLGIAVFDLEALVEDMVNGAPDLEVTFHLTAQDAIDGENPIENPGNYQNVDPYTQFIYVRAINTVTNCELAEPLVLVLTVSPAPMAPEDLEDLVQCDDQDNNGQDNQAFFDLTVQDPIIHAAMGTDETTLTINYFTTAANAENGFPRITNPEHYYGTDGQTIWVRVETPGTECFSTTTFELKLDQPLLLETPSMLILCNEALPNDGRTEFDLTVKDDEILGEFGIGQGMTVTYFEVDPRVDTAATPIPNPTTYTNPAPPQGNPKTLYVMVTTPDGCKSYTTLTIKVLPLPEPDTTVDPIIVCDDNNSPDGVEVFDLTDAEADIRNNDFNMVLTYYRTEEDANNRENPILNYTSFESGNATIWVRAEANTQDPQNPVCFQVVSFELIVNPLPALGEAGVIEPYAICEQNTDGIATFDFNTHMDEIFGDADPADYTVKFYLNDANRLADIAMPYVYTNTSSPNIQNIIVWAENNETGCINWAPLTLLVEEAAIANPVTETFYECDYDGDNDGVFTFDLTRADDDALGTQNPADYSVTYYTSLEDAEAGTNAIGNPTAYNNTPDYQMIWVRVTNESTVSGCYDITTLELFVERIPEPVLSSDHTTVCITYDTNETVRAAVIDSGLDATHTFVWYKDGVVIPDETGPTLTVLTEGSYNVVATSVTGCVSDPIDPIVIEKSGPAVAIGSGIVVGNAFSDNQVITVLAQGYGEYQYRLDNGPWQNSNVFENVSHGLHTVYVRDVATDDPCDDLEFILEFEDVSVIDFPNFFTPNGDGYNDTWNVLGLGDPGYAAVIYIFDRYGKLIKQLSPSADSEGWDGTFNGTPLPADDYWFTVTYTEGEQRREFKAHFAMKR